MPVVDLGRAHAVFRFAAGDRMWRGDIQSTDFVSGAVLEGQIIDGFAEVACLVVCASFFLHLHDSDPQECYLGPGN